MSSNKDSCGTCTSFSQPLALARVVCVSASTCRSSYSNTSCARDDTLQTTVTKILARARSIDRCVPIRALCSPINTTQQLQQAFFKFQFYGEYSKENTAVIRQHVPGLLSALQSYVFVRASYSESCCCLLGFVDLRLILPCTAALSHYILL